ncbi:MAG: bifunctional DNA-formamidopyrimidine glycosylase/DNA-(apurinic or apyrimidinic site) lyase [Acidobacteriota bacterium]
MPELPEVEHIARSLDKLVSGRRIVSARLLRERLAPDTKPAVFARRLKNADINFVHRRGKHILFDLGNGRTLITHLRMSGSFSLLTRDADDPKFTHAVFYLDDDTRLAFSDQRHFGLMKVVETKKLYAAPELAKLAPEPFSDEFDVEYVKATLKRSGRSIKEVLLDQTKFCGLGNIYAVEALFRAGIDPRVGASQIPTKKAGPLHESVRSVLYQAIEYGSSVKIDPENIERSYFNSADRPEWLVYDRQGEECRSCNSPIKRIKQGSRSTFFCPKCQRKK